MLPNGSQPYGVTPYGSEYMQAARKYGVDPYNTGLPVNMAAQNALAHARAVAQRQKQQSKAKSRQQTGAVPAPAAPQPRQDDEHDIGDGLEADCFALVSTEVLEKEGLRKHPDKIAEAAALSSVSLPAGTYRLCLPAQVIQGRLHIKRI